MLNVHTFENSSKLEREKDELPHHLFNQKLIMDGLELLKEIHHPIIKACFFDPQYRGILDKQNYGNEGKNRGQRRSNLPQMAEKLIANFIKEIDRVLLPSSHLFLWVDKFHLCQGVHGWLINTELSIVDLITWEKHKIGMGYRTRRKSEYLLVLQKKPVRAKDIWTSHNIPDVWSEEVKTNLHPHAKPINLQQALIESVTLENDIILDPAMGSGSVLTACQNANRRFVGCDVGIN